VGILVHGRIICIGNKQDKQTLKRINMLISDIQRQPFTGIGDPEPLRHNWSGYWSTAHR
jgi:Txe/YoeB family toxin of toxin-antitoxin system